MPWLLSSCDSDTALVASTVCLNLSMAFGGMFGLWRNQKQVSISNPFKTRRCPTDIELTVGVLDVPRPKPHPDMLERCVAYFGLAPEEALYVGDQQIDADAAAAAGLAFVAVGSSVESAAHRIDALSELVELLPRL